MPISISGEFFLKNKFVTCRAVILTLTMSMSRWQDKNVTFCFLKNVNILEFDYYIWNPCEKCIQNSPNKPGIGSLICEIDVKIWEIWETNILFLLGKTNARILSVKTRPRDLIIVHCIFLNSGMVKWEDTRHKVPPNLWHSILKMIETDSYWY